MWTAAIQNLVSGGGPDRQTVCFHMLPSEGGNHDVAQNIQRKGVHEGQS